MKYLTKNKENIFILVRPNVRENNPFILFPLRNIIKRHFFSAVFPPKKTYGAEGWGARECLEFLSEEQML